MLFFFYGGGYLVMLDVDRKFLSGLSDALVSVDFPPVGDSHSTTAYTMFGEITRDSFLGKSVEFDGKVYEGDSAKDFFENVLRKRGKQTGLALNYGGTYQAILRGNPSYGLELAMDLVSRYYSGYPVLHSWMKNKISFGRSQGFVKNIFGRVRYLPFLPSVVSMSRIPFLKPYASSLRERLSRVRSLASDSERLAINFPIQSDGSDQLKLILISVGNFIKSGLLNRVGDGIFNRYRATSRVVSVSDQDSASLDLLCCDLDELRDGNCRVLVKDVTGRVVQEYDRLVQMPMSLVSKYNMCIEF